MGSKVLAEMLKEIPQEVHREVEKSAAIALRVNEILKQRGLTKKALAEMLGKRPSEVTKWLSGYHNLTLKSIVKLEAALGEELICVPTRRRFVNSTGSSFQMTVHKNVANTTATVFTHLETRKEKGQSKPLDYAKSAFQG